jgi:glycosyltransferase involved in cell wall biosynthesis
VRVSIVTPDLRDAGGVREVALFVARSLRDQLGASVRLLSLATSRSDRASVLLHQPHTWRRSLTSRYTIDEFAVDHVGAVAAEIEVVRYAGRRATLDLVADCDVVHVVCGTPAFAHAVRGFRGPVVVHFASFVRYERKYDLSARRTAIDCWRQLMTSSVTLIERAGLRRADAIIALNRARLVEAQAVAGRETPAEVVHTGVDTEWFSPGPYQQDGYLLTVGRLRDPRKNVPLLLRAYAAARQRTRDLPRLVLAGPTAPMPDDWALRSALSLTDSVRYTGPLDRRALAEVYRGASAFILSSDEEGQGIAIVEAMASGLPIVATSCGGPSEIITDGHEGLLTRVRSVEGLTDAIVRIDADLTLRRQMSHAARRRAVEEFSLDKAGARLCRIYRTAGIASCPSRPAKPQAVSEVEGA